MLDKWETALCRAGFGLGSAPASGAGDRALAITNFSSNGDQKEMFWRGRQNQHPRRVRSPIQNPRGTKPFPIYPASVADSLLSGLGVKRFSHLLIEGVAFAFGREAFVFRLNIGFALL